MGGIFDTLPFRAVRGAFAGFEDGLRGKVDTNEKFRGGYRENDPSKKSAAGRFVSDYMGVRGGSATGKFIGKWGGGIAASLFAGQFLYGFVASGLAAGVFVGAWPIIGAVLLTGAAAVIGGAACGYVGERAGAVLGALGGGMLGAGVGLYNGVLRKGVYAKAQEPEAEVVNAPENPVELHQPSTQADVQRALQQANAVMQDIQSSTGMQDAPAQPAATQREGHVARVLQQASQNAVAGSGVER